MKDINTCVPDEFINKEKAIPLNDIELGKEVRISTNISEFDRILGGGFVKGSLILLAGDLGLVNPQSFYKPAGNYAKPVKKYFMFPPKKVQAN